jgi:hypothetical protein
MTLRFSGLIAASTRHSKALGKLSREPEPGSSELQILLARARKLCESVESECNRVESSPAELEVRSREAFAWFSLLSDEAHLRLHILALRNARLAAEHWLPKRDLPVEVRLLPLRSLWRASTRRGVQEHRFSEVYAIAEASFWELFFEAYTTKNMTIARQLLREVASSEAAMEWLTTMEESVPDSGQSAVGEVHDLEAAFLRVNETFFGGAILRPHLAWSRRTTRRVFGHYHFARDELTVSLSLDSNRVPEFVLDFIMYHELLHKQHGLTKMSQRLYAHTAAFRSDERKFPRYKEAQDELLKVARRSRS